ncbi:MAG: recombinase family protein [Rhodospirillaceae bacterium]|jgi:site-specific DNA recombinase|nr:recombinase family protein [Rhodospirillaceae bacterium]
MKAAIYARYSSDNQRDASIEDQVRECRKWIEKEDHAVTEVYADHAISGASILRPGYQKMLEDARNGAFDILVAEALDRLSRDQENIAGLYKQLTFAGVRLITLSEGEVNELHVGLKGTMNALFLKDLAQKTRRGLEGRIRQGKSGGGNAYGYDVVKKVDAAGEPIRGDRQINEVEADIVRRIFTEFTHGISPRAIAYTLNREGISGPAGNDWGASTIHGNWRRGTGILNNELYIGRLVWNRQRFIKDPATGKRQARLNPEANWVIEEVPHLRIVEGDLWSTVKERQQMTRERISTRTEGIRSERARRPRYLLSGLLTCGVCGGGYSKINQHHYGCSTARNKGTCGNRLAIRRTLIEASVLDGLKERLMHPDCVKEFIAEYHREINRAAASHDVDRDRFARELEKTEREVSRIIDAIKAGVPGSAVKDEMQSLEERQLELQLALDGTPAPFPRLHPNLAEVYRKKVENLTDALNEESTKAEAVEAIRELIDEVRLVPAGDALKIELYGELASLLQLGQNKHPRDMSSGVQITMVAGVGFEPTTFRL